MTVRRALLCGCLAASSVIFFGCKSEVEEVPFAQTDILGRWELSTAQVDGKETDRLRNLYFVFLPDTSLQTNILGSETNFKYQMVDMIIEQMSTPRITYHLLDHSDTTMSMQTELRGKTFAMKLNKAKPKVPAQPAAPTD